MSMKKTGRTISCFSASICRVLNEKGINILEEQLFCSEKLLALECKTPYDSAFIDLESVVMDALTKLRICIQPIKIVNLQALQEELVLEGAVLMKTKIDFLRYSTLFSTAITMQRGHYVVLKREGNKIRLIDSYIPTTPLTQYDDWYEITEEMVEKSLFFRVFRDEGSTPCEDLRDLVREIQQRFLEDEQKKRAFEHFKQNVCQLKPSEKHICYEMSSALSITGTVASRRVFKRMVESTNSFSEETISSLDEICKQYNLVRMLLLKCYLRFDDRNIEDTVYAISKLHKNEERVLRKLNTM